MTKRSQTLASLCGTWSRPHQGLINDNGTATQEIQKIRIPSSIQSCRFAYQEDAQVMIDSATSSQPAL